jgi:hypothetical protein
MTLTRNAHISGITMLTLAFGAVLVLLFIGPSALARIRSEPLFSSEMLASSFLLTILLCAASILFTLGYLLLFRFLYEIKGDTSINLSGGDGRVVKIDDDIRLVFRFNKDLLGADTNLLLLRAPNRWYVSAGAASSHLLNNLTKT